MKRTERINESCPFCGHILNNYSMTICTICGAEGPRWVWLAPHKRKGEQDVEFLKGAARLAAWNMRGEGELVEDMRKIGGWDDDEIKEQAKGGDE